MVTRVFDFAANGGLQLSGRLEVPDGPVRGWSLFAHCFSCGKDILASVRIARALTDAGIGVLRFDFTGLGRSDGGFGPRGLGSNVADLIAAAAAMEAAGMPPALLIGHSFGGAAVLAAAGRLPSVAAIATIAAPFDPQRVLRLFSDAALAELRAGRSASVTLGERSFTMRPEFLAEMSVASPEATIAGNRRPLLVLHAPDDATVPIEDALSIFAAARQPKSFVALDGCDHLLSRPEDSSYVAGLISAWAGRHLRPLEARTGEDPETVVATETGLGEFQVSMSAGSRTFLADEPKDVGGLGSGPTPFELLAAALAACTTMTLRMYTRRKGWAVGTIRTSVGHAIDAGTRRHVFRRRIAVAGAVDETQRGRLIEIAGRCPVHRVLEEGALVETVIGEPPAPGGTSDAHADEAGKAV